MCIKELHLTFKYYLIRWLNFLAVFQTYNQDLGSSMLSKFELVTAFKDYNI